RRRSDVWVFDIKRGVNARLSPVDKPSSNPVWSPDGTRIAFSSQRKHQGDMYVKAMAGAGTEEPLIEAEGQSLPQDWSPDGRNLIYEERAARGERKVAVKILPLFGDRRPVSFFQRGIANGSERISPNGRWIAFTADDSGRQEISVAPVDGSSNRVQVSNGGGDHPRWSRDGKELFYLAPDGKLMSVSVFSRKDSSAFDAGPARALFDTELTGSVPPLYDVSPDGRFLVVSRVPGSAPPPITLLVNWTAEERP
ncbi:MAG TPA: hypothetical protein VKS03_08110, partial [Thermoanaerobaculia bacterium]|nr:hypothetical protein [Thermoanaerobaculia bacterium]